MRKRRTDFIELLIVFTAIFLVFIWNDVKRAGPSPLIDRIIIQHTERSRPVSLLFVGDVMLGRNVGKLIATYGTDFPFAHIATATASLAPDFFIANLEGPITTLNAPDTRVSP